MYTHHNNELRRNHVGQHVSLKGWVAKSRNLGGVIFIDLRDRYGVTQVIVHPGSSSYETAERIRSEFVISVSGVVIERSNKNKQLPTGEIEIDVEELIILNTAKTPPIRIADQTDALEDTRLKYRYLDLRRPVMQQFMIKRSQITNAFREFLLQESFLEIETPILGKSTPEGARDYLVPSRLYPGEFYALPQSPQIYKQLFMVAGFERYFQIARCFRDEDLRADRQPEFTQVDIECSFMNEFEIQTMVEKALAHTFKKVLDKDIKTPFIRMPYYEAMAKYGSDKPDTRFEMTLQDIKDSVASLDFNVFNQVIENNGSILAIHVENSEKISRKTIDAWTLLAKKYKAKGLAWVKLTDEGLSGPVAKFFNAEQTQELIERLGLTVGSLVLIIADTTPIAQTALGAVRLAVAKELNLIPEDVYHFLWVVDWPLYEYDDEEKRYYAAHHPFTAPHVDDTDVFLKDPKTCRARAYDVVLNGSEIGGGSIRIHNEETQNQMFRTLGFTQAEIDQRFGFLVEALKYGTPPHGGIALGLDRIIMIMTNTLNIKDVVAFPKTQSARCQMMEAPGQVDDTQLDELSLIIKT